MRRLLLLSLLSFSFAAFAQSIGKIEENANIDPNKLDPASKARLRVDGAAGGTGARIPEEASGGATVGSGGQHRHSTPAPKDPGRSSQDKSSQPEASQGARGK